MILVDELGIWVALTLGILNAAVWALVIVKARQLWAQYAPLVSPLLHSMFAGGHGATGDPSTSALGHETPVGE